MFASSLARASACSAHEFSARQARKVDLPLLARAVPADERDRTARHVARANFAYDRHALLQPSPALVDGAAGPAVYQRTDGLAERRGAAKLRRQGLAVLDDGAVLGSVAQDRHDDDLPRRN